MKQSIGLIILQFFGIILGFISVFYVAGSLTPEVYAVVGVYTVISTVIVVFSNTGLETYAIRNVLAWKEIGENDKIKLIITQAIVYRTILAGLIVMPIIGYAIYMSKQKFDGQYLELFIFMGIMGIINATNDATILSLRAFNKYFSAALATYSVNVFGRLLALVLFVKFGFNTYIYTIIFLPLVITIPTIFMLKEWLSMRGVFQKANLIESFKKSKSFGLAAYFSYAFNYFDQLIISIFMSAEILGAFTVGKSLFFVSKLFIENIFDPMIQNLVSYRNNIETLYLKLKRILKIRNIVLLISFLMLPFVIIYIDKFLIIASLDHYHFLNYFIVTIYLSQIASIGMKVNYNYIALFYKESFYLKLAIINALLSISFLMLMMLIDVKFIFSYILITNLVLMFYTNKVFNNKRNYEICT